MRRMPSILLVASLFSAACGSDSAPAEAGADALTGDTSAAGEADTTDSQQGSEDTSAPEDTATATPDVAPDVAAEDVAAPFEVPEWGLAFTPDELSGVFIFGITSDPLSALSQIGAAVAGINPIPVIVDVADGVATIRAAKDDGTPIKGLIGVVESYPASELEDGRVLIDLRLPLSSIEVQLYADCTYTLTKSTPAGAPLYADSLATWPVQETYASTGSCGQGVLDVSKGVNVHFLRRADANPGFEARAGKSDVPFGYFIAGDITGQAGGVILDRMPLPSDASGNGTVHYLISQDLPEAMMPAIDGAFESWNDTIEQATGVRPLSYARATGDVIPWDPRFRTIDWDSTQTVGAVAPFVSDPRTGEMFGTSVILWIGDIQVFVANYLAFLEKYPDAATVGFGPAGDLALTPERATTPVDMGDGTRLPPRVLRRHIFDRRPFDASVVRDTWLRLGKSLSPEELSLQVVAEFLVHELGHNFGLRHNFKGSMDRDGHEVDEPSSTVMDYVVGMGRPGNYDLDAIRYGYGGGAESKSYLYCTDEDVYSDPGCARWDYGHPLVFALDGYDALAAMVPQNLDPQTVQGQSQQQGWNEIFNQLRDFVNSEYEGWDPGAPIDTYTELLGRIACEGECAVNPWLRARLVNYMLRTVKGGFGGGGAPFPALDETQTATLYETLYALVVDDAQPLYLRTSIIDRLSKAQLGGAGEVLASLANYFMALESPTPDEAAVLDAIQSTGGGQ